VPPTGRTNQMHLNCKSVELDFTQEQQEQNDDKHI
jgi:hypothetical protein